MSEKTALHERHVELGGRLVDFAGWQLPVQFEGVLAEHQHCRSAAAVFDTSHMGQLVVSGQGAAAALDRICTQNASGLASGRCRYGFLLNEAGGVIDDTILMRPAEEEFLLVVNAGPREADAAWIRERLGAGAELTDRTAAGWAKIDIQGPRSFEVLSPRTEVPLGELRYFSVIQGLCAGVDCVISRTGYTGELGYEIMAAGKSILAVFDALLAHDAVKPAGLGARDSLRLEMGYPLYGHELDADHTPLEAGLEGFLRFDHDFIGAEALREQHRRGAGRRLAAFQSASRRRVNPGDAVILDDKPMGNVTSGAFSPSLEVSIGMGYVEPSLAVPGTALVVDTARATLPVTVAERPMYKDGTCRVDPSAGKG